MVPKKLRAVLERRSTGTVSTHGTAAVTQIHLLVNGAGQRGGQVDRQRDVAAMRRVQHGAHIRHAVDDVERVVRRCGPRREGALLLERSGAGARLIVFLKAVGSALTDRGLRQADLACLRVAQRQILRYQRLEKAIAPEPSAST